MAYPQLQAVRERYQFCCGYCGVSEMEVGGELTVDHFVPLSAGGTDGIENLVYSCVRCNQYKGALSPDAIQRGNDRRLLYPLGDDLSIHLLEDEATGRLEGLKITGRFHIEAMRLNRPALIANRQQRRLLALLEARLDQAVAENTSLR